jgi:hypothetical protein
MSVVEEIVAERKRQIELEGYTHDHDDSLRSEDLMEAALCYFGHATGRGVYGRGLSSDPVGIPRSWPWEAESWKPKDPRRDLIRAGALCLAEQERCLREGLPKQVLPEQTLQQIIDAVEALAAPA